MKNLKILGLILVLSLSTNLLAMWPWSSKSEQPKIQVAAQYGDLEQKKDETQFPKYGSLEESKEEEKEKLESKKIEGEDYISQMPDEIILNIILQTINKNADTNSKAFKDAINLLSTSKRFRNLNDLFMKTKDIKELKSEIEALQKDIKILKNHQKFNRIEKDQEIAVKLGLVSWIKHNITSFSRSDIYWGLRNIIVGTKSLFSPENLNLFKENEKSEFKKLFEKLLIIFQMLVDRGADVHYKVVVQVQDELNFSHFGHMVSLLEASLTSPHLWPFAKILLDKGALIDESVKDLMEKDPKVKKFIEDYLESKKSSGKQESRKK